MEEIGSHEEEEEVDVEVEEGVEIFAGVVGAVRRRRDVVPGREWKPGGGGVGGGGGWRR